MSLPFVVCVINCSIHTMVILAGEQNTILSVTFDILTHAVYLHLHNFVLTHYLVFLKGNSHAPVS